MMWMRTEQRAAGTLAIAAACTMLATGVAAAQTPPAAPAPAPFGAAAQPVPDEAAGTSNPDAGYVLGQGDIIEVSVVGRSDFRSRARVQVDGTVQLPLIGTLTATGKTSLQFGAEVREALRRGGYFANPAVAVDIVNYSSRYVTVLGQVAQPGLVPVDRAYRVSEILAKVGGARPSGADTITIRRVSGEEQQLDIVALATGGPESDPMINPGDKLFLAEAKTFYIYGQISAPGNYKLEPSMTLRQAIARSGGLTPSGSEGRIRVFRQGQEIKKYKLNDTITPGDVVVVGERFF